MDKYIFLFTSELEDKEYLKRIEFSTDWKLIYNNQNLYLFSVPYYISAYNMYMHYMYTLHELINSLNIDFDSPQKIFYIETKSILLKIQRNNKIESLIN